MFKIGSFPHLSETFVVSHFLIASKLDYEIRILVNVVSDVTASGQEERIKKNEIDAKIIVEDYGVPDNQLSKLIKFTLLLLKNRTRICSIIRYYRTKKRFSLIHLFEFIFYSKFRNYDIVHIQYGTNSKPIDDLKESGAFTMPVITTFHGHDAFFPINGFIPKEGYYEKLFQSSEWFTANTPYLANQLQEIDCPIEKIVTIPMPVDTSFFIPKRFQPLNSKKKIKLLSVGRLESIKGHSFGIEVVSELCRQGYNVYFDIIGEGKSRKDIVKLVRDRDIESRIRLLGAKKQDEVRRKYWESHIFLMTSTAYKGKIRETQGLVSLEAQACGLPVVAFDSGGVRYTINSEKSGILCREGSVSEMVQAVKNLIDNPAQYQSLALGGPLFVENNFSLKKIEEKWSNFYGKLTSDE